MRLSRRRIEVQIRAAKKLHQALVSAAEDYQLSLAQESGNPKYWDMSTENLHRIADLQARVCDQLEGFKTLGYHTGEQ